MHTSWQHVAILALYIIGALVAVAVTQGDSSGQAIAYMFAGAAANQGAKNGLKGKGTKHD